LSCQFLGPLDSLVILVVSGMGLPKKVLWYFFVASTHPSKVTPHYRMPWVAQVTPSLFS
jgi:hypothetical protein